MAWLLQLATICAGQRVNDEGDFVSAADDLVKIADIKRDLADSKVVLPKPALAHAEFVPVPAMELLAPLLIVRSGLPLVD